MLVREQKNRFNTWKKSHFVFLTQNLKQVKLPRQKNSSLTACKYVLTEDLLCLLHLCYGISEKHSVMLKIKVMLCIYRSQIICVIRDKSMGTAHSAPSFAKDKDYSERQTLPSCVPKTYPDEQL